MSNTDNEQSNTPNLLKKITEFIITTTGLIVALTGLLAAVLALWTLLPKPENHCITNYENLSIEEQEKCELDAQQ